MNKIVNIRNLFRKLGDVDDEITCNIRRITGWDTIRVSSFLEKDINSNFTEEEYHAIGYYCFMKPGEAYFAAQLEVAGKRIICLVQENGTIEPERLMEIKNNL